MKLSSLNYHKRRILGQLCSIPSAWKVVLDYEDAEQAEKLVEIKFLEVSYCAGLVKVYQPTDLGRKAWKEFRTTHMQGDNND